MEIVETNKMIKESNLDVRTITMGISLMDCADSDLKEFNRKIYDKITKKAEKLVKTGDDIARQYGIPVVNKRISVTPIAMQNGFIRFRCRNARQGGKGSRSKLYRRIFSPCSKGFGPRRRDTFKIHTRSACCDGYGMLVSKHRLIKKRP